MPNPNGWTWDDVWAASKGKDDKPREPSGIRIPSEAEREDWINSMPDGVRPTDIREHLRRKRPVQWAAAQVLLRWMERELKLMGLNPDDARWYL